MLADHEGVGTLGLRGAPYQPGDLVVDVDRAQATGHVGDVDPPAVEVVRRPQPARHHRVRAVDHRRAQRGVGVVELGQRAVAHPALVGAVGQEVVERPRRRALDVAGGDEPLVRVAGVVGRQVAQDPPAARVHGGREPDVRRVAAEQRVDLLEGRGVVAVVALAGEDRRRVDDADADVGEVVEVLGDPVEVAAEVLQRRARVEALEDHHVVPLRRHRPLGGRALGGRGRPGEPVREDLVDDRVARPVRRRPVRAEPEVEGVRRVVLDDPDGAHPALAAAAVEQEAVVGDRVVHRQRGLPPHGVLVAGGHGAGVVRRLGVVRRAHPDLLDGVGRCRCAAARSRSSRARAPRRRRTSGSRRGAARGEGS